MRTPDIRLRKALLLAGPLLLLSAGASDAATKTYQYYRFLPTKLRDVPGIANSCQMSEFRFIAGGTPITAKPAVSNPGGNNPATELPANLVDNDTTTKWLDFNKLTPLVFDFGTPTAIDSYVWATGGDAPERDPVDWVFSGSTDGNTWVPLDIQKGFTADPGRGAFEANPFSLPDTLNPVITTYASDYAVVLNGTTVNLNWEVDLADSVTLSGVGSVPATGAQGVTPPNNALTSYTLSGTNTTINQTTSSTLTVKTVAGGSVNYRYVRFTPTKRRDDTATNLVQLADFYVVSSTAGLIRPTSATNPGGTNAPDAGEGALKATDGDPTTKWLDGNFQPLILDFGTATTFDSYGFNTANDAIERDPVRWRLEGSNDSTTWTLIDDMTKFDFPVPQERGRTTQDIPLPGSSLAAAIISFTTDAPTLVSGQPAILSWTTEGADSVTIDNGVGTVAVNGSVSVSPTTTTTYTLTTKKGDNLNTTQLTVTVINPTVTSIAYSNFDNAGSELITLRDASVLLDPTRTLPGNFKRLRLTPDAGSKVGSAWFAKRVNLSQGFDTTFDLSFITLTAGSSGADGIGFTIQNVGNSQVPTSPEDKGFKANSFTVNFDSYINDPEPSAATVQLVANGTVTKTINLPTDFPAILGTGVTDLTQTTAGAVPYHVRVTYGSGLLNVYFNNVQIVTNEPVSLSTLGAVDAGGKAYVGFSGRTGGIFEAHDVTAWSLTEGAPAASGNPLAVTSSSINSTTGALGLSWISNTGKTYRITTSADLTTWTAVKTGIASGGATTSTTATFTPGTKGFFRVEEE